METILKYNVTKKLLERSTSIVYRTVKIEDQISQKLYAQKNEINSLLEAINRDSSGRAEVIIAEKDSGIGKPFLINKVHKPMTEKHGCFIAGNTKYLILYEIKDELLSTLFPILNYEIGN